MKHKRKLVHPKNFKNLIIITGQQRSGKTKLSNIISTFKGPVNIRIEFFLDTLLSLKRLKLISKKLFNEMFQIYLNNLIIDAQYGRNFNLKKNEDSSIWNSANPNYFLNIIKKKFTKLEIKKKLLKNNEIIIVLHNFLEFVKFLSDIKFQIKIINIKSHPIDQIYSMYQSKTNFKFNNQSRELIYMYKNKKYCFVVGLENKMQKLNLMQKILLIKHKLDLDEIKNIKIAKKKFKYMNISYLDLVDKPKINIDKISKFIKIKQTKLTERYIGKNLKKTIFLNDNSRKKRFDFINTKLKEKKYKLILNDLITNFEKKYV